MTTLYTLIYCKMVEQKEETQLLLASLPTGRCLRPNREAEARAEARAEAGRLGAWVPAGLRGALPGLVLAGAQ